MIIIIIVYIIRSTAADSATWLHADDAILFLQLKRHERSDQHNTYIHCNTCQLLVCVGSNSLSNIESAESDGAWLDADNTPSPPTKSFPTKSP